MQTPTPPEIAAITTSGTRCTPGICGSASPINDNVPPQRYRRPAVLAITRGVAMAGAEANLIVPMTTWSDWARRALTGRAELAVRSFGLAVVATGRRPMEV